MGDVINLNQYRKRRERLEKAKKARENRAKSGRTGAEKAAHRHEAEKTGAELERKVLTPAGESETKAEPGAAPDGDREPPEDSTPSAG